MNLFMHLIQWKAVLPLFGATETLIMEVQLHKLFEAKGDGTQLNPLPNKFWTNFEPNSHCHP